MRAWLLRDQPVFFAVGLHAAVAVRGCRRAVDRGTAPVLVGPADSLVSTACDVAVADCAAGFCVRQRAQVDNVFWPACLGDDVFGHRFRTLRDPHAGVVSRVRFELEFSDLGVVECGLLLRRLSVDGSPTAADVAVRETLAAVGDSPDFARSFRHPSMGGWRRPPDDVRRRRILEAVRERVRDAEPRFLVAALCAGYVARRVHPTCESTRLGWLAVRV